MANTFQETVTTLITNAMTLLGAVGAGETVPTNDYNYCLSMLNAMVKAWQAQGIHLWTCEEGTVYLVNGQTQYLLNVGASFANAGDGTGTPVETTTKQAASGTSVVCTTTTGMSSGDNIGVQMSNNTMFWTTINGTPSGNTVTLTSGLTTAANAGALVATYTTQMTRPLSVTSVRLRDNNGFDKPIWLKPRNDYMMIPQKGIAGDPVVAFYDPDLPNGRLFLWPTPNDVSKRINLTYLRPINDLVNPSDNFDFPDEWLEALTYNLAVRIAPAFGFNLTTSGLQGNPDIIRMANQFLEDLKAWDAEQPYVSIIPSYRYDR